MRIEDGDECTLDGSVSHAPALPDPVGPTLQVDRAEGGTTLSWSPDAADSWNLYRGSIVPAEAWEYDETCFAAELSVSESIDPEVPAAGTAFSYLVGAVDACGESAIGEPSGGGAHFASSSCVP